MNKMLHFCILICVPLSILQTCNAEPALATQLAERISIRKCNEYQLIYREVYELYGEKEFGDNLVCPESTDPFIAGGRDAALGEFPHMVSLQLKDETTGADKHYCGGALISDQFVLTAAHCIKEDALITKVVLGDLQLYGPDSRKKRKEIEVAGIKIHPNFNPSVFAYDDIALIKLKEKLTFEPNNEAPDIRPACLAQLGQTQELTRVTACGWGHFSYKSGAHLLLQAVNLTIEGHADCQATVRDFPNEFPKGIPSGLFCASDLRDENISRGTCKGDSGGPLSINPLLDLPCMDFVVGITSGGSQNCSAAETGLYTRVEEYLDWIEDNVWINPDKFESISF